jgi:hypothetical protein
MPPKDFWEKLNQRRIAIGDPFQKIINGWLIRRLSFFFTRRMRGRQCPSRKDWSDPESERS